MCIPLQRLCLIPHCISHPIQEQSDRRAEMLSGKSFIDKGSGVNPFFVMQKERAAAAASSSSTQRLGNEGAGEGASSSSVITAEQALLDFMVGSWTHRFQRGYCTILSFLTAESHPLPHLNRPVRLPFRPPSPEDTASDCPHSISMQGQPLTLPPTLGDRDSRRGRGRGKK